MNNYSFNCNNSFSHTPSFSQNEASFSLPNNIPSNSQAKDIVEIKTSKKKQKSTFEKIMKGLAWVGGICLGAFVSYKFIEYKKPGYLKNKWNEFFNSQEIKEKSKNELSLLQEFNKKFSECKQNADTIRQQELDYIEDAFKKNRITETEKQKFKNKIDMRYCIRTFNAKHDTDIPLTPYGGVAEIAKAYERIKDSKDSSVQDAFAKILDYKIGKLEEKIALIESKEYSDKDIYLQDCRKYDRTNDLLNSFSAIKNKLESKSCDENAYYVDITSQHVKNTISSSNSSYKIQIENELGEEYDIKLSKKTFNKMFPMNLLIQQKISDCYLVGTLNAIINNPKHRCEFYQMFSEDEKSITFTFKDGFKVKFPKDDNGDPKLLNSKHNSLNGDLGYQMFEEAYALHRLYERAINGYKKVEKDEETATAIKEYAQKDNKSKEDTDNIIQKSKKYIDTQDKPFDKLLEGGTIHEVANSLFGVETKSIVLSGYHPEKHQEPLTPPSDSYISKILLAMQKEQKSIVVGRDEFRVDEEEKKYSYNDIEINNSHFSVVRYYNPKTEEVHVFESNTPEKVLILPLRVFNQEYSLLYGF